MVLSSVAALRSCAGCPCREDVADALGIYRVVPAVTLFVTFYILFLALTPSRYRKIGCRKWPGALLITVWWLVTVELLPGAIGLLGGYDLTYGSLAGVMIALLFFFVIGLGVVMGAELNAALAEAGADGAKGRNLYRAVQGRARGRGAAARRRRGRASRTRGPQL